MTATRRTGVLSVIAVLVVLGAFAAAVAAGGDAVTGRWMTEKKDGVIEVYAGPGGALEGKIVGGGQGPHDRLDEKNPDPKLRSRPLLGVVILRGMKPDGENRWSGGTIYDPDTGNTYRCKMHLESKDVLELRGYLGISLFGRTTRWTRPAS